jgi:adenosylcobinamide-GDP ribazoletransferase
MALAPVVGFVIGALGAGMGIAAGWIFPSWVDALLVTGFILWITRAIHMDGLADTVDAVSSARTRERALEIARQSDIGPFGVVAIVLAIAGYVAGIVSAIDTHILVPSMLVAFTTGRLVTTLSCSTRIPAARSEGLGAYVAGTITRGRSFVSIGFTIAVIGVVTYFFPSPLWLIAAASAIIAGLAVTGLAIRRLGGITGDTLGAATEVGTVTALLMCTMTLI